MAMFKQRGGMLIEALASSLILGVGALAVTKLQTDLVSMSHSSKQKQIAINLAEAKIAELRELGLANNLSQSQNGADSPQDKTATFNRQWQVQAGAEPDYRVVNVIVTWDSLHAKTHTVNVSSVVSNSDQRQSGLLMSKKLNLEPHPSQPTRSPLIPEAAVDKGDGTSEYQVPDQDVVLTYKNESGEVLKINGQQVLSISGKAIKGTGKYKPSRLNCNALDIATTTTNNGTIYCRHTKSDSLFDYQCWVSAGWSGTILLSGLENGTKSCAPDQPYQNITMSLINQNHTVINASRSCDDIN